MRREVAPLLTFLTLTLTGCGLLFMHGPPPGYEHMADFKCSTSTELAIVDFVGATLGMVRAGRGHGGPEPQRRHGHVPGAVPPLTRRVI